jgi:hypothetical protein
LIFYKNEFGTVFAYILTCSLKDEKERVALLTIVHSAARHSYNTNTVLTSIPTKSSQASLQKNPGANLSKK